MRGNHRPDRLRVNRAAAVPEGPDEQLLLHPFPHTEALEGGGAANSSPSAMRGGVTVCGTVSAPTSMVVGGDSPTAPVSVSAIRMRLPAPSSDEAVEVDPGRHQKGESKSAKRPAAASFGREQGMARRPSLCRGRDRPSAGSARARGCRPPLHSDRPGDGVGFERHESMGEPLGHPELPAIRAGQQGHLVLSVGGAVRPRGPQPPSRARSADHADQLALRPVGHLEVESAQDALSRDGLVVLDELDGATEGRFEMGRAPRLGEPMPRSSPNWRGRIARGSVDRTGLEVERMIHGSVARGDADQGDEAADGRRAG